ncbi:MAG TPA: hypothetical protein VFU22_14550 [Roseiflexaceae bacterium]|nr:hypothetical protein [Roseiflexaceae bacterium]
MLAPAAATDPLGGAITNLIVHIGDTISVADVTNANINVKSSLTDVEQRIGAAAIDEDTKALLRQLIAQLPTASSRRTFSNATIAKVIGASVAVLLVAGIILWQAGWRLTSAEDQGPMRSAFNVAVAAFGTTDDATSAPIAADQDGAQVAKDLVEQLSRMNRDEFFLAPEFRYLDNPITGQSLDERQKAAAVIAAKIKADVVIYGYIERGRRFVPEYYVSPRLEGAEEAYASPEQFGLSEHIGATPFGTPIEVRWPFRGDADRSTFTRAQLQPRFNALSMFLFGMAAIKGRQYELALDLFTKAEAVRDAWPNERSSGYGKEILDLWLGTTLSAQALLGASTPAECSFQIDPPASDAEALPEMWRCAEAAYNSALKRNQSFVRAYLGLGNLWFYQAEKLANLPRTESMHAQRCDAYTRSAAQFSTALEKVPDDDRAYITTKAHYSLGLTEVKLLQAECTENSKLAVEQLTAVVTDYHAHPEEAFYRKLGAYAQYHLGAIALLDGDLKRAQGDMASAAERYRAALALFEDTMTIAGPFTAEDDWWQDVRWDASSQLGQAALNLSIPQRAIDAYVLVTKAYEDGLYTRDLVAGEAYYSLGVINNQQGRFKEALALLEKGLAALENVRRPNPAATTTELIAKIETGDAMYNLGSGEHSFYKQALDRYQQVYAALDQPNIDIRGVDIDFIRTISACRVYRALQATEAQSEAEAFRAKILENPDWQGFEQTCVSDLHREQPTATPLSQDNT